MTVAGLTEKRGEIAGLIRFHKNELRKLTCDLDHLDASIRLFDPEAEIVRVKPYPTKHRAGKGQMVRFVVTMLRDSAEAVTSLDVTHAMIAARDLNADPGTVVMMRKRVGACLTALKRKGTVRAVPLDGPYQGWVFVPRAPISVSANGPNRAGRVMMLPTRAASGQEG